MGSSDHKNRRALRKEVREAREVDRLRREFAEDIARHASALSAARRYLGRTDLDAEGLRRLRAFALHAYRRASESATAAAARGRSSHGCDVRDNQGKSDRIVLPPLQHAIDGLLEVARECQASLNWLT